MKRTKRSVSSSDVCLLLGVTVIPLDETTYQIFAPSQAAMDEAKEMIDELLSEEVHSVVYTVHILVY